MSGSRKRVRCLLGMLAVVVIFATSIIVTVAPPVGQKDQGWVALDPLTTGTAGAHLVNSDGGPISNLGYGKVVFLRSGCYTCHTMMVEDSYRK